MSSICAGCIELANVPPSDGRSRKSARLPPLTGALGDDFGGGRVGRVARGADVDWKEPELSAIPVR
jgi:hypothetical protein